MKRSGPIKRKTPMKKSEWKKNFSKRLGKRIALRPRSVSPLKKLAQLADALWSQAVKLRDNGRCRKCGGDHNVQSHHVFKRRHTGTAFDVDAGLTLCTSNPATGQEGCHEFVEKHAVVGHGLCLFAVGEKRFEELVAKTNAITPRTAFFLELAIQKLREFIVAHEAHTAVGNK